MKNLLVDLNYSISKEINCISIKKYKKKLNKSISYACINCGYCVQVCPVNLLPQKLYLFSKSNNHDQANISHIMDCIECEICEKVCPSNIPLVKYFKNEKITQNKINIEKNQKKIFFHRFQSRKLRIENQKKMFLKNQNYLNQEFFDQKETEKNIRKKIIQSAIARAKLKNKIL